MRPLLLFRFHQNILNGKADSLRHKVKAKVGGVTAINGAIRAVGIAGKEALAVDEIKILVALFNALHKVLMNNGAALYLVGVVAGLCKVGL